MGQLSVWPFPPRLVFSICLSLPTDLVMALDLTSLMQSSQSLHHELRHHKTKPNKERELTFFSVNNSLESASFWLCVGYGVGQAE